MKKAIQWTGCFLGSLFFAWMAVVLFRPQTLTAALFVFAVAVIVCTGFFFWVIVQRPEELRKKLGPSKEEEDAWRRHSSMPPPKS